MIKLLTITAFLCIGINVYSQDILVNELKNDIPDVSSNDILDRFQTAMQDDYGLLYVNLSLEEVGETKMAGLDNKTAIIADLTIRVYSLIDDSKIGYKTFKVSGSGRSVERARKSVVRAISRSKRKINTFLAEAMKEAQVTECNTISQAVDRYLRLEQFNKAYAVTSSQVDACKEILWSQRQQVYDSYQEQYCDRHIIKVQSYLSTKDYAKAILEIQNVSPTSRCNEEVKKIIEIIKNDYQSDYDQSFRMYMASLELETLEAKERRRIIDMLLVKNIINAN
jgi:hypothetical protein